MDNVAELVCTTYDKLTLDDGGNGHDTLLLLTVGNGTTKCANTFTRNEVVKLRADLQLWLDHIDG